MRLVSQDADLLARDSEGRTPLHHAVMRGHLAVVDQLLAKGGPSLLLAKDILNCTPVHLAAVQNQVTLILRLVDSLLEDVQGRTPLHEVARRRCMQDFMGFLHLGWDNAATVEDDCSGKPLSEMSPLWAIVGSVVDLKRPGLPKLQQVLGWHPLHVAAMSGNIELIKRLVQQFDCDLRVKSMNSWTPLHYAAAYNQVSAIEALCALGCEVAVQDAVGSTPMHVAAGEGHLEAVQALVRMGCSPQVTDRDGCTPLYCAAAWNRIEAVRLLEKLHCPSSLRSLEGRTPTHVAAEQGWVDLLDVLVTELGNSVDSRDNYQFTPLHSAANGGHVEAIRRLAALNHDLNARDYLGRTPLHYAAMHGRAAAVDALVELGAGIQEKDSRGGYTPLHLAADAGQCETISRLAQLGGAVDAPSSKALPPLALALMKGPANVDAIALLVELGADVDAVLEGKNLETPLHVAARSGRLDIVQRLIDHPKISVASRTKDGSTPLHYTAAFGQTHVLEPLVNAGSVVDARDNALNTPLHLAAGCGFLDTVQKLVDLGADVNARDCTDCTPLQNAAHGTYSALAAVPANGAGSGAGTGTGALGTTAATSGYARFNPPHQPQLTPAQQAAQAALTSTSTMKRDGLVPVRTGLAWSQPYAHVDTPTLPPNPPPLSLPGSSGSLSAASASSLASALDGGSGAGVGSSAPGGSSSANPSHDLWTTWKSLGLTQLLKKAYKQQQKRGTSTGSSGPAAQAAAAQLQQTQQTVQAALQQMQAALQHSQAALQQQLLQQLQAQQGQTCTSGSASGASSSGGLSAAATSADVTKAAAVSENLDTLLRRSEQLHLSTGEQDRSRLVKVVEKLVALGANLGAVDNEGRTALHLAAGCGDRTMALRLVELGTDVNCKDSVGGTAMHHAAMANKKDMMFALARLGCDWRARADGIDGATASFVLCGQHGKTTRQQRLLDAKLKRVFQEGSTARAAGRNPLADAKDDDKDDEAADLEAEQALADAAMAALLEEVEAEAHDEAAKKAKKKKKKGKRAGEDGNKHSQDQDDGQEVSPGPGSVDFAVADAGTDASGSDEPPLMPPGSLHEPTLANVAAGGGAVPQAPPSIDAMSEEASEHAPIREALDAAAAAATKLLAESEAHDENVLVEMLEELDSAVDKAVAVGVSAKYGKKVRKKLQGALDRARGILPETTTYASTAEQLVFDAQPSISEPAPMSVPVYSPMQVREVVPEPSLAAPAAAYISPPPQAPSSQPNLIDNDPRFHLTPQKYAPPLGPLHVPTVAATTQGPSPRKAPPPGFAQGSQPAMPPAQVVAKQQAAAIAAANSTPWGKPPPPPPPPPAGVPRSASNPTSPMHAKHAMPPPVQVQVQAQAMQAPSHRLVAAPPPPQTVVLPQPIPPHLQQAMPQHPQHPHAALSPVNYASAAGGMAQGQYYMPHSMGHQGPPPPPPPPPLFGDPNVVGHQPRPILAGGGSLGGLFEAAGMTMYDSTHSPAGTPSPHETSLFGGSSLFGGPSGNGNTSTVAAGAGAGPDMTTRHSSGYGSFSSYEYEASGRLPGRFTEMDLSGGPVSAVGDGYGAPLDSFIGHDLVNQVFGGGGALPASGGNGTSMVADHGASGLLSIDLLGAIDGQEPMPSGAPHMSMHSQNNNNMPSPPRPPSVHKSNARALGLDPSARPFSMDGGLSLPEDAAALFSPPTQPLVGLPGGSQSQFRSLW